MSIRFRHLPAVFLLSALCAAANTCVAQSGSLPDRHWHIEVEDLRPDPENGLVIDWVYFVFHDGDFDLYDYGKPAPEGLRWLANHGYRDRLVDQAFEQLNDEEWQWVQIRTPFTSLDGDNANSQAPGPFFVPEGRFLTYFARVYPSDDAFVGNADPQRYELIDENGDFTGPLIIDVYGSDILDAGTKENLEADLIGLDRHFSDERGDPFEEPFTSDPVLPHPGYNGSYGNPDDEPVRLMVAGETYCQESGTGGSFCHEYDPASIDFSQPGYPLMRLRINLLGSFFHGAWSGSYFNPALSGEGFSFEFFDENPPRALFYWYTFQPDDSGEPMWLIGEGWLDEYQVFNFDIYEVTGGSMASISNPNNADLSNWGSGLLLPRNASDPACRGFRLFLTPEDETLELDLPSGGNFGTYVYPLEALTTRLTGLDKYCGNTSGVSVSIFP